MATALPIPPETRYVPTPHHTAHSRPEPAATEPPARAPVGGFCVQRLSSPRNGVVFFLEVYLRA